MRQEIPADILRLKFSGTKGCIILGRLCGRISAQTMILHFTLKTKGRLALITGGILSILGMRRRPKVFVSPRGIIFLIAEKNYFITQISICI